MDWKKEKISASELEKKQKEYMSAALAMMKRSSAVPAAVTAREEPDSPGDSRTEKADTAAETAAEPAPEAAGTAEITVTAEVGVTAEITTAVDDAQPEPESGQPAPEECDDEPEPEEQKHDDKYGVYTADELSGMEEYKGEGLKKAAEILEEMTRSTEMMKKLADGADDDGDPDTTDFPDFSCADGEDSGGGSFREKSKDEETLCFAEDGAGSRNG